ncbi:bL32 family ribosomal protein [Rhodotorula paludigena]|uniref:bL32 family ribosomal protein n=1 Tax=Rhodotorula paludigena TaxID=86838 RepID=UPI00316FAB46
MAAVALPTLRTSRQPLRQLAASLLSASPIFRSSASPSLPAVFTAASSALSAPASFSVSLSAAPALPSSSLPSLASLIPDTLSGLRDLLPPWVFAVPKRRTTHGAKRMRSSNKGLKEKQNLVSCPSCGAPKLAHHLCHECHVSFRREIHREAKQVAAPQSHAPAQQA